MKLQNYRKNFKLPNFKENILVIIIMLFGFIMMAPFFWMFATSFRPPMDSFNLPPSFFPTTFQWGNYLAVFKAVPFFDFFYNSVQISVIILITQVFTATTAAYAFARLRFPGREWLFIMLLSGLMIPHQVTIIPLFIMVRELGLMDTHAAVIIPSIIYPFGMFLLRQFMKTIPNEFEDSASIDGASRFTIFRKIILPFAYPAVSVVAVFSFITSWNLFFTPLIFLNTFSKMTLPLGLTILEGYESTGDLAILLAGVIMSLIPVLVFYLFCQKYLIEGLTNGAVKG